MTDKKIPFSDELIRQVAQQYGTPFHIYDEKGIHDNMKRLQKAFSWNPNFHEYFAVKATPNPWIMKSLKELGQWPWPRNLLARLVRAHLREKRRNRLGSTTRQ